ncbi:MAG: hypothetical protein MZV63_23595 [Marinilabiliales bacterium]|nr:hypothetical protein [Marinilabiliales bacterium]
MAHGFERRVGMDPVEFGARGAADRPAGDLDTAVAARAWARRRGTGRHRVGPPQRRRADARLVQRAEPRRSPGGGSRLAHLVAAGRWRCQRRR